MRFRSTLSLLATALVALVALPNARVCAEDAAVAIGAQAGKFGFTDIRFSPRALEDFGPHKAYVFVFTTIGCPLTQRYLPRLKELAGEFGGQGVQFAAVNVGADDSIMEMAWQAIESGAEFPFVKDFDGQCARALGATRTPEAVVLDADRRIRYRGRIDDQFRLGGERPAVERADLREAIADVLAGEKVRVEETPVDGCAITFPRAASIKGRALTYEQDIAPLMNKHCVECHRPGTAAPFVLTSYEKVKAKAATIAEVVEQQRMPPWFAHPGFGTFIHARGLAPDERAVLVEWARGDRAPGDLAQAPKPPEFPEQKWAIGEPDLIVTAAIEQKLPETGYIPYRYIVLPHVFLRDTWVQGIEIMPSNPRVVHHANLAFATLTGGFDEARNFLTGKVPGGIPVDLDSGVAMLIPAGSVLALQVHYVTTGKEETDRIAVGLRFAHETVTKRVYYKIIENSRFNIPPGAPAHLVAAQKTLECDATGLGLFAHMHLRGKDSAFIAHYPDGKTETLLALPNYSFDWQLGYQWPRGTQHFPKGTTVECRSHFDNSTFNPFNPDPTATVKNGPQTFHEMMQGYFFYTNDAETLNVQVDPKTGIEIKDPEKKTAAK